LIGCPWQLKRIHTLDRAEHRELKLKERCGKLEKEAEAAKADNDLLRKAVEVLQGSLKAGAYTRPLFQLNLSRF